MRVRVGMAAVVALAPWALAACGNEDGADTAACPDVATFYDVESGAEVDYEQVMDAVDCDGETSEREARCLRTPWARAPSAEMFPDQVAPSPEKAIRLTAGEDIVITKELSRTGGLARVAVEIDGDTGVFGVRRLESGWMVVEGTGCAAGEGRPDWQDEPIGEECQRAIDEATADEDGDKSVICLENGPP